LSSLSCLWFCRARRLTLACSRDSTASPALAARLPGFAATSGGQVNTAIGDRALDSNTTGDRNIAVGSLAGANLTSGNDNVDIANANRDFVGRLGVSGAIEVGNAPVFGRGRGRSWLSGRTPVAEPSACGTAFRR
jgi:hypothetical protein